MVSSSQPARKTTHLSDPTCEGLAPIALPRGPERLREVPEARLPGPARPRANAGDLAACRDAPAEPEPGARMGGDDAVQKEIIDKQARLQAQRSAAK